MARALVAALLLVNGTLILRVLPDHRIYARAAEATELATYPVMLAAAVMLYVYFWFSPGSDTAWLATAAVFGTAQGAGYAVVRESLERQADARPALMLVTHLFMAAVLCAMLAASGSVRVPGNPVALGLSLAAVMTVLRLLVLLIEPSPVLQRVAPAFAAGLLLLFGTMAVALRHRVPLPRRAAQRLAAVIVMLGAAQVLMYPAAHDDWRGVLVVLFSVAGTTLLVLTSFHLMQDALSSSRRADVRIHQLEAHVRDDRTLRHELAGTIAAIRAASELLAVPAGLDRQERLRLQQLLVAETARVDRLLAAATGSRDDLADVDLDALIDPLLFAHGIRGRVVAWHPTGDHVWADRDHLREVLDVLLDNAARHAQSPILELTVDRRGGEVEIAVADRGPGIPPEIAGNVLEWGIHGPTSSGQGIGLNVAHSLVEAMGGKLRIEAADEGGTRVVVSLKVSEVAHADPAS